MAHKSHLKFISERQLSEIKQFNYNNGFDPKKDKGVKEKEIKIGLTILAESLNRNIRSFDADKTTKYSLRDPYIRVPHYIDHIEITFQNTFDIKGFYKKYYSKFGLEAVSFYDYAKKGLFAIIDRDKFDIFISNIQNFIEHELADGNDSYYGEIKYISSFKLLMSDDIIKFKLDEIGGIVYLSVINIPLTDEVKSQILHSLLEFLTLNKIDYYHSEESERIELKDPTPETVKKIIHNFDIIESAICSAFTTVGPSSVNVTQRRHRIEIENADEDLPIVGIIDTGIAADSILAPLIINDDEFSLDGNPLVDIASRNRLGHGTAVAGLVALGRENHKNNFNGEVLADAKVLSVKINESGNGYISETKLLSMLYRVKEKYPKIRIFTLTSCYSNFLRDNESFSDYTYLLDKFSYETNSLIFICTGNNENCIDEIGDYDLSYFNNEHTNISTPANSMNNITIGAAACNLKTNETFYGISMGPEFPALYTRRGHMDLSLIYNKPKNNKNYFKPDVIDSGGDLGFNSEGGLDWMDKPALTLISARPQLGLMEETGSSFAAPLTANLGAKIIKRYPSISNESVKALIINSASTDLVKFDEDIKNIKNRVIGYGKVNELKSLHSNENSATLILEDVIEDDKIKVYPINFPDYLVEKDLGKTHRILKITATLCFKFMPIKDNQLSYNPIHMAFCIFKNQDADDIMKPDNEIKSMLKSDLRWSENGRYKSKPIPYSNTQKITFNVNVEDLNTESKTFKLAIHSFLTEQVIGGLPRYYPKANPFSIVMTIEETIKNNTGLLYEQIKLKNHLEIAQVAEIEIQAEV